MSAYNCAADIVQWWGQDVQKLYYLTCQYQQPLSVHIPNQNNRHIFDQHVNAVKYLQEAVDFASR